MKTVTTEDYLTARDEYQGWCRNCEEFTTEECEPDARNRKCDQCDENLVYGAEEALICGFFGIED